jgi:hypothetical protein
VDIFDSIELSISRLIQIWEYALNWFTMKPTHKPKLDICDLLGLGAAYHEHVYPYVQMIHD